MAKHTVAEAKEAAQRQKVRVAKAEAAFGREVLRFGFPFSQAEILELVAKAAQGLTPASPSNSVRFPAHLPLSD